jgi:hypothetical protein
MIGSDEMRLDVTHLFQPVHRTRTTDKRYNEPVYSFLNTSARPSVERIRQFWEGWFAQYDDSKKGGLAARFQSHDDHTHLSAFLELFAFAVLRNVGCDVQVEPTVRRKALEFLATMRARPLTFYTECTATTRRTEDASADAREDDILEAIDKVPTGRFVLGVRFVKRGAQSPSISSLRRGLLDWLSSLKGQEPTIGQSRAEWAWEDRGWTISIWAAAVEEEGGLGVVGPVVFTPVEHLRLRRAIDRKASKYGPLSMPLLVITASTEHQTERDLMTALVGDKLWQINLTTRDVTVKRKANGVFYDSKGPRNRTLSAVMHGHFGALGFADRPITLVHHPFASHPLPFGLFPFCEERHFNETGEPVTRPAIVSVGEFFGLPSGWPFFDQDP